MSKVTVQNFADELKRPVDELLAQLKDAGVSAEDASSPLSSADKLSLLNYLRKKTRGPMGASTNAGGSGSGRITMKRKETSELKLGGGRGLPSKTVSVEVRKKRVFKAPPPPQKTEEDLAREAAEAEA